jgi:predicted dehydrogenase
MNRRNFIKSSSLATVALASGLNSYSTPINRSSQKGVLKLGLIGSGWYGMVIAKAALQAGNVIISAVADVDTEHLSNSIAELTSLQGSTPRGFKDYKELLDVSDLDGVMIGTPPHWHALQFIAACEKGLPIYCEKPLSYDIDEGKAMVEAARKAGNIVQIGFQRRQNKAFKKAKDLIQDGRIGEVYQIGAQIHYNPGTQDTTIQNPPESLDWDEWCGPAPKLPYSPSIGHLAWRLEKEYGNGHLVDWGIHNIDIIRTIMGYGMPQSIQASGGLYKLKGKITTPDTLTATLNYSEVPLVWQHRLWGTGEIDSQYNNGVFFYGDKGTLFASDNRLIIKPTGNNQEQEVIDLPTPDMQEKHVEEFINAVRSNNKDLISCTTLDGFHSSASVLLSMIAYETGEKLIWDNQEGTVTNSENAVKLLARPYRQGYNRPKY